MRAPSTLKPAWLWLSLATALVACDDLQDFDTGKGEVFRGAVIGSPPQADPDGGAAAAFLLYGLPANVKMELTFDSRAAARGVPDIGTIETYECLEPLRIDCPAGMRREGPLALADLAAIPGLVDDVLSRYTFPGGSRVRNFMLSAPFETDGVPRSAMLYVSLMEGGDIEVRVMSPALETSSARFEPIFGIFRLERTKR